MKQFTSFLIFPACVFAAFTASAEVTRGNGAFQKQVLPVLKEYCYDCHGDGADKGKIALDKYKDYGALLADKKLWDVVREHVSTHVMPPDKKPLPTQTQRDEVVQWIEDNVFWVDPAKPDPGHVTLRRLNRVEYNNTVRDIFKIETRPADSFPPDDTGYGFDNIGAVLTLSPILMEKYVRAARAITDQAVWVKPADRTGIDLNGEAFNGTEGNSQGKDGVRWFYTNSAAETWINAAEWDGWFRFTLRLSANQCGNEKPKFALLMDDKEIRAGEIKEEFDAGAPNDHWERFAWDQMVPKGRHKITLKFLNDFADASASDPRRRDRNMALESLYVDGPIGFCQPQTSPFLKSLFNYQPFLPNALELLGDDFDSGVGVNEFNDGRATMATDGFIHRMVDIPTDGHYRLTIKVQPEQAGPDVVKIGVKVGRDDLGQLEVKGPTHSVQTLVIERDLRKGVHDLQVAFLNDFYEKGVGDRNVIIERITIEGPITGKEGFTDEQWSATAQRLGLKMFRRPLDDEETKHLLAFVKMFQSKGAGFSESLGALTEALLCSPHFLFRGGCTPNGAVESGTVRIDEFSLASRLSYLIWSSVPDDELLNLAAKGELRKNLAAQLKRMIAHDRAKAMTENFAGQWLMLRDMALVTPDNKRFPEFTGKLAADMKQESQLYFDHILRGNRSVLEFLDSDYTFLNERLSKFYKIGDVKGTSFQKVSLAGTPRGGILTQGGILTITSHPTRTSPVKRGKFVLEQILGTPPPPPPADVPAFPDNKRGELKGTLRQRFEQHRANPSCAACHAFLDPMGFAFEHYDAIGRWRDEDNREKIDASGKLISGQQFDGAEQLRKVLVTEKKQDFLRCLTENLMTYALGRGVEFTDRPFRDEIMKRAVASDYKFQDIILAVCESVPFQRMRADEMKGIVKSE